MATEMYGDIQRDMDRDTKIVRDMETHSYSEELELRRAPHWSARAELRAALRAALRAVLRAALRAARGAPQRNTERDCENI